MAKIDSEMISVIVPVYNVEKYIDKCVQSIVNQTYTNLEIILVDDGSTDSSYQRCMDWTQIDSRIVTYTKENGGLSDARNYGLNKANGTMVTYIDSDDWVHQDLIKKLYEAICINNAEVAICRLKRCRQEKDAETVTFSKSKIESISGETALEEMLYQKKFDTSACGKLYRMNIAGKFLFPKGKLYEDLFTLYKILYNAPVVSYISDQLYFYRFNANSIMNYRFSVRKFDEIDAADEIVDFLEDKNMNLKQAGFARQYSSYCQILRNAGAEEQYEEDVKKRLRYLWNYIVKNRNRMMKNRKARMKNRIAAMLTIFGRKAFVKI
jgi:glycosyltransferase involved in cell wall biosynthesis